MECIWWLSQKTQPGFRREREELGEDEPAGAAVKLDSQPRPARRGPAPLPKFHQIRLVGGGLRDHQAQPRWIPVLGRCRKRHGALGPPPLPHFVPMPLVSSQCFWPRGRGDVARALERGSGGSDVLSSYQGNFDLWRGRMLPIRTSLGYALSPLNPPESGGSCQKADKTNRLGMNPAAA